VYIQACSIILPDTQIRDGKMLLSQKGKEIYNVAFLFGPDGKVLGQQKKVHLIDLEGPAGLDIVPASVDDIQAIDTPLGKVGIAICLDAFHEDVLDRLVREGAQILLQPSANPEEWSLGQREDWLRGSYTAVMKDERFRYAVNPMMTGDIFDLGFYGQSSIISRVTDTAPTNYEGLPPTDGFAALARTDRDEEILVVKVPNPAQMTLRSE
ncbi:MAG: carbon-nitrogen hydrolase family protein, partial [Bacillota bacterium]|nr:carbon-nitrogen hydrolase family protein [Bacillota bacterium]